MMRTFKFLLFVPLLLAAQAGIAHAGLFSDDEARKQIQTDQARIDDLQKQTQSLSDRLAKTETALQNNNLVDLFEKMEDLKSQIANLRGQIEVLNNSIAVVSKQQRDMYVDLDTRLRALEQPGAATPGKSGAATPTPAPTAVATAAPGNAASAMTPSTKENDAYNAALALHRNRDYQNAIAAFQNFLQQYPRSALAPRAQYWIGDSYYNLRDYKNAIASQQTLMTYYPDSPSVPDAMLNIATSQQDSGDTAGAKKTLQDLVAKYPVSDSGQKARRRLDAALVGSASGTATSAQ